MTYKDALLTTLSQYTRLSYPWRCTRCLFCILYLYHFVSTGIRIHAYTNLYRVLFGSSTIGPKLLIKSLSRLSLQPLPWNNGWFYSAVSTFICYKHIGVYVCSMHACKVVFVIHQFMGCLSILLWPKLFPSMANDGFQNSLHWKTRWFSLQRGKRLVALGWFQTLADCKSTTKLVVFRLAINHSSCPCIFIFVFCICLKIYFPTEM